ncbi:MAG TPA: hypothetical protein VD969_07710 [Symbiobacteriaceae bacterium]|nr:hypothetical protein [Symbiobacteriaceae bacterium]
MGICAERQIPLVIVLPEDLTLQGMQHKIGRLLPTRDPAGADLLTDLLEMESHDYRQSVSHL